MTADPVAAVRPQSVSPKLTHSGLGTSDSKSEVEHKRPTSGRPAVLICPFLKSS